ncbi:phage tail protein I [Desulfosarcina sp. OttesenSCG-928-G10]|nr:phage tail protein I [Desulfosarcina sp. OttesenSCG-928-G10]MDL2321756.1 phage tail protein I [Desulfosarcina sp. OttesenSCG-928-B08]
MSDPNFRHLGPTSLADLIAPALRDDEAMSALTAALDLPLQELVRAIPNLLLWARLTPDAAYLSAPMRRLAEFAGGLKPLTDEELELMAWQEHVDFWRPHWPRHVREDLVRNATRWHRIKGTPAGLKMAMELFGYQVTIEEEGPGLYWATYQLGLSEIADTETVREILEIATEMQPARCRLWRMYTTDYDRRPVVWGKGPASQIGWSNGWWSYYSGTGVPDIDDDLIVSFGSRHGILSEAYDPDCAFAITLNLAVLAPYRDRPVWGQSLWSEEYLKPHGLAISELFSSHFAVSETLTWTWEGQWDERPWALTTDWDRPLPKWQFHWRSISRSQACWGEDDKLWSDINTRYGATAATIIDNPGQYSSAKYSDHDCQRRTLALQEMHIETHAAQCSPIDPALPLGAWPDLYVAAGTPLHEDTWQGEWDARRWYGYVAFSAITNITEET